MLYFRKAAKLLINRALSTSASSQHVLEHLTNRTLIRVSGQEVSDLLQGLITNDMKHLSNGPGSMYAMFLNNKGRVLYDTIIYKLMENNTYLVECNKQVSKALEKHLMMYRVRRKIDIVNVDSEFKVYALFSEKPGDDSKAVNSKAHKNLLLFRDPRTASLGTRVLSKADADVRQELSEITAVNFDSSISYRYLRYRLGVGEGVEDLPPGNCFPLESNCDYLHGVSFHKGCYIGQELTARVHHTGVIRKRLLPIQFSKVPSKSPEENIVHENVNLGKLKGVENDYGLGLLRLTSLDFKDIKIGDGVGNVQKPSWWPVELSKEKVSLQKNQ